MTDPKDNRRSFRVPEAVYLSYSVINDDDFAGGLERHRLRSAGDEGMRSRLVDLDARLDEHLFILRSTSKRVAEILKLLNDKINLVIEQSPAFRKCKGSLARQAPQVCVLSADGMVFGAAAPLATGTKLVLRLLLAADSRYIETFGRVVRIADPPDNSDSARPIGIAVEFEGMAPAQKELLIQHMFSRESETLRMRRLELDSMD